MARAWAVNGRFRRQTMSGVQRVAAAYVVRLSVPIKVIEPSEPLEGLKGHLWEQVVLPLKLDGAPLWSPCNTGPVAVRRQVVTIHDATVFDHPEWFSRNFVALYKLILPTLARRCMKIVTVSSFSRSRLLETFGLSPNKIDVVWNGVDERYAPSRAEDIFEAKRALGLSDEKYFVTLSTLEPRKNLKLVFQAWALAQPHLQRQAKLLVIGKKGDATVFRSDGPSETAVEGVIYMGYVDEALLPKLLAGAEALLYPSLYEGFGLPIIEAMACGTPAIITRLSSLPEVAGDAAIYVDAFDAQDMSQQIIRMAHSRSFRDEYSGLGLDRAKRFSWSESAGRMDQIFEELG